MSFDVVRVGNRHRLSGWSESSMPLSSIAVLTAFSRSLLMFPTKGLKTGGGYFGGD